MQIFRLQMKPKSGRLRTGRCSFVSAQFAKTQPVFNEHDESHILLHVLRSRLITTDHP